MKEPFPELKIILVTRGDPSKAVAGTEILAGNLAVELVQQGHEVSLVYEREKGSDASSSLGSKGVCLHGFRVVSIPFLSALVFRSKCAKTCRRIIRDGGFDVVIALGAGTFPGYIFKKIKKLPDRPLLVYYAMDSMIMEYQRSKLFGLDDGRWSRLRRWIWYFGLIRSDRLSCINSDLILSSSKDTLNHLVCDYDVPSEKIQLVYEGIPDDFSKGVIVSNPSFPTFLHVGGGSRKGTVFFLESLKILKEKYDLKVMGIVTRADSSLEKKAIALGVSVELRKFVPIEELKKLYASCTALVVPSLSEGFCLPVIEAASFGKPSIVTSVGSLPELVSNGHNGLVVPPGNINQLSQSMYRLARDSSLRQHLSQKAKEESQKFRISFVAKTLLTSITEFRELKPKNIVCS